MDPINPAPAAPAQPAAPAPAAPTTASAVDAAIATDDTRAFREARRAERIGKPLPAVAVDPAPAPGDDDAADAPESGSPNPAAPAQPTISKRQQQINDYERRIAEQNERIARLEASQRQPAAPVAAAAQVPPKAAEPAWKRIAALPQAPQLADFDGDNAIGDHAAAMALFVHETLAAEDAQRSRAERLTVAQRDRVEKFVGQLDAARTSDPEFVNKLTPEVRALKPFGALLPGEPSGPLNVLAEQIYDSPIAPKVLLHLAQNPADLAKFAQMPRELAALPPAQRTRAHMQWIVREFAKLEGRLEGSPAPTTPAPKTLTDAPGSTTRLGDRPAETTDPMTAAIKTGSTSRYRELRREERAARMRR